ncbi:hypothetical protein [Archangium sp.]|jgi:hypothetical protein|uniref:hypothetical protein n=1 Tax=Archangium sp. TaxID=1872627 RepID=UPI003899E320
MSSQETAQKHTRSKQAAHLEDALNELLAAIRKVDGILQDAVEPGELREGCPAYFRFERLIEDLALWRDMVEEKSVQLAAEVRLESKRSR